MSDSDSPTCCGGGNFYGHEPYCDCGRALDEKATAAHISKLEAVCRAAQHLFNDAASSAEKIALIESFESKIRGRVGDAEPLIKDNAREPCTLDNCGHMRQLDAVVDLLGMSRGARSVLDELRARERLYDAAVCFTFGEWYAEHIVDTDGKDWGWVVSKDGDWAQQGMTRDEAIAEACRRAGQGGREGR